MTNSKISQLTTAVPAAADLLPFVDVDDTSTSPAGVGGSDKKTTVSGLLAGQGALAVVAATSASGFALQNGTPVIVSWTAPNDGNLHYFMTAYRIQVTVNETGGAVNVNNTSTGEGSTIDGGNRTVTAANSFFQFLNGQPKIMLPGETVQIVQTSALTAGAAIVYAAIWGA